LLQWFVRTVDRVIREARRTRIDVIHSNYYHFHVVAALAGLFTGRRYVWHWRGQLEQPDHEGLDRQPVSASSRLSLRWSIVRRLGAVSRHALGRRGWSIAVSEATLRSVRPFVGTQYAVIYNGVPLEGKSPASGAIRKLLLLERAARIVGMVASFNPRKGHHVFLEAAAEVCAAEPVAHFVHIGGQTAAGQQQYRQRLIDRTHELHLEHRVHWMGHQDNVAELFADMEIAVLCTLPPGEGLPLTILEAMAQGVPVVASDCGPSREIITHDVSGLLVEPGNPRALAAAIRKLLLDEEARRRMGEAGQRLCRERFDIQQTVRRVEDVYRRIVDSTTKRQQWAPLR
jgi:glycosyltransferase involved in cell wall biosynthesis